MKVLLIRPESANIVSNINIIDLEPLELEYLYTAATQEGFEGVIFDALYDSRRLERILAEEKPDVAAITGYITQESIMLDYARIIKEYDKNIKVIIGGVHAEINFKRFYSKDVDYIVHSSSLRPFRNLLRLFNGDSSIKPEDIDGICFKRDDLWPLTGKLQIDPDELPIPDRTHFYKNKERYRYLDYTPCAIVKTAFSCPYKCSFCYCRKINQGHYAARDMELVVEEIEGIDCENIHIVDDTFLIDRERVMRFISLIREKGIKKNFICYSRADFIVENEDLVKELSDVGVRTVLVGLEAINDGTLNSYNKVTSADINEKCVSILHNSNMDCVGLFIVGTDAAPEDFRKLYRWIKRTGLKYASFSIFTPIVGTDEFEKYKDRLLTKDIRRWDFLHLVLAPEKMSRLRFYFEFNKLHLQILSLGRKKGGFKFINYRFLKTLVVRYCSTILKGRNRR